MATQQSWIRDGTASLQSGVSSGLEPDQVMNDQAAWAANWSLKNGRARTRPPFIERLPLPFGHIQGVGFFDQGEGQIIVMIEGFLYEVRTSDDPFGYSFSEIPLGYQNSPTRQVWMEMTPGNLVIQNGEDAPIIYNGAVARRAERDEVPRGRMMAYGNGRLWVVVGSRTLVAGDIAGTSDDSHLKFTETSFLLGGGTFTMPSEVTGLSFLPSNDGTTGYGALLVGGRDWMNAVRADITNRDSWQSTQGFVTTLFRNIGFLSHDSIVEVNQDLYFRDGRGNVRSVRQAVSDYGDAGLTPISREVSKLLDFESDDLMWGAPAIYFENRYIAGASPYLKASGYTGYKDMAVLNFTPVESMRGKAAPAWEGEWHGLYFSRLVTGKFRGVEKAFVFAQHEDGTNRLWEIAPENTSVKADTYFGGGDALTPSRIHSYIDTRRYSFESPFVKKRIERLDLYYSQIKGEVDITIYFRSDNHGAWRMWDTFSASSDMDYGDGEFTLLSFQTLKPKHQTSRKTLSAADYYDTLGQVAGFSFQIRVSVVGHCQVDKILVHAMPLPGERFSADNDLPDSKNPVSFLDTDYKTDYTPLVALELQDELGEPYVDEGGVTYITQEI